MSSSRVQSVLTYLGDTDITRKVVSKSDSGNTIRALSARHNRLRERGNDMSWRDYWLRLVRAEHLLDGARRAHTQEHYKKARRMARRGIKLCEQITLSPTP